MVVVVCIPCSLAIRVLAPLTPGGMTETDSLVGRSSGFWPDQFPCPCCEKPCTGILEQEADARALAQLELRDLTPAEAFAAFNGLGFPEERNASLETVSELFRTHPVRAVRGKNVRGQPRAVVDHFELWDGTKIYFGAGADGAVVYRIVPPISYANRLLGSPP